MPMAAAAQPQKKFARREGKKKGRKEEERENWQPQQRGWRMRWKHIEEDG
jgi:hypothetical protein